MKPRFIDDFVNGSYDYIDEFYFVNGSYDYIDEFYFVITVFAFLSLFVDIVLGIFFIVKMFFMMG